MKNMMNAVSTSISKTANGIGTGVYIPDELIAGIDPNQLTTLLTNVMTSVYSAIYADEKKQYDEMMAQGVCPICGQPVQSADEQEEDEDAYDDYDYGEDDRTADECEEENDEDGELSADELVEMLKDILNRNRS